MSKILLLLQLGQFGFSTKLFNYAIVGSVRDISIGKKI